MARSKPVTFPPETGELPSPVVDNHTHFSLPGDGTELPGGAEPLPMDVQIERGRRAGVIGFIHSGCEILDLEPAVELARRWKPVAAAIAIHPNEAPRHAGVTETAPDGWEQDLADHHRAFSLDDAIAQVADLAAANPEHVVAIGESGMDLFRTAASGLEVQRRAFREHIALAKELGLPLQIHDREAHAEIVDILRRDGGPEMTVFHCFSGDRELAEILNEHGWYASFAGPITFKSNQELRDACRVMDPDRVLVETDAPYLTPAPYRGRPNAPYVMTHTVRAVAEAMGMELTYACQVLLANTRRVYGDWFTS
ncbi:MAG TPA: TatD family hydrolase [Actinomycetaceae bacterium]|nr:TatD family hydrolase [Actinomycetaceae bacterium]